MKSKFNVNDVVIFNGFVLTITMLDAFGSTPHYGFLARPVETKIGAFFSGWTPTQIIDATAKFYAYGGI